MQEEVENRTINLAISTAKLTTRSIISGIRKYSQHREKVKAKKARDPAVHGKQSVKKLLSQNQGATNVEIDKSGMKDFERLARKYGVDFAVRKDKSVNPPRYFVFVRSKDSDALDAICKEHDARTMTKDKKPSVLAQLKKFKEIVAAIPKRCVKRDRSVICNEEYQYQKVPDFECPLPFGGTVCNKFRRSMEIG